MEEQADRKSKDWREFYDKNKERINAKRRKKYWEDPANRSKLRTVARERYRSDYSSPDKHAGYTVKKIDGQALYTIQYVAQAVRRSSELIRGLEKEGIVPKTTYTDSRGWRLYTAKQVEVMGVGFENYRLAVWDKDQLSKYLFDNWVK